jgi:predicted metal-dependent hydrolase
VIKINKDLWRKALQEFNDESFFECHETLEKYWLSEDDPEHKNLLQGFIHIAAAFYHDRNLNIIGFQRQLDKSLKRLAEVRLEVYGKILGADLEGFYHNIRQNGKPEHTPKIRLTA